MQGWTINDVMKTDCIDVDEILLKADKKKTNKKGKVIKPLSELVNGKGG